MGNSQTISKKAATPATKAKTETSFFKKEGRQDFFQAKRTNSAFFSNNRASIGIVQAKLSIGKAGDVYEKEADQVAGAVVQKLAANRDVGAPVVSKVKPVVSKVKPVAPSAAVESAPVMVPTAKIALPVAKVTPVTPVVAKTAVAPVPTTKTALPAGGPVTPIHNAGVVQEKCAECEKEEVEETANPKEEIQKKPVFEGGAEPPDDKGLEQRLSASRTGGSPLPDRVRTPMEGAFGADFSNVRIHDGHEAHRMSDELGAKAFTTGKHIYFGPGQLDTGSPEGKSLLAHELTHTIQQGASEKSENVQRQPECGYELIQRGLLDSVASAVGGAWDATGGKLVNAAGDVIAMGEDFFWDLLNKAAPGVAAVIRKISQVGIVEFLKNEVKGAVSHIFDGLENGSGILAQISPQFASLLTQARTIVTALAAGDCKPLFAALDNLKLVLSELAGEVWTKITDFFAPIGDFFEGLWNSIGAPFIDWIKKTAGDVWDKISAIGKSLWDDTAPIRAALARAWDWIKGKLGLNFEDTGEEGLIQWVERKASEAWEELKREMEPIIAPMRTMVNYVRQLIPLDAILHLRETINGWLDKAIAMGDAMGADGGGVAAQKQQISLRDQILPAILQFIGRLRLRIIDAGSWVSDKIGSIGSAVSSFFNTLSNNPVLSAFSGVINWLRDAADSMVKWAQGTVQKVFVALGDAMVYLSKFVRPILDLLTKIVGVLGDLLGKLPDLIMGPVWWALPDCIKDPIKNFFLDQILGRMPFFKKLKELGDVWDKLENAALLGLKQVFVDGNLAGAIWTFFSTMLDILKIPPKLVAGIIKKGASVLKDILNAPLDFLVNFLHALKGGFNLFLGNIGKHLMAGLVGWLTGQLEGTGIQIPKDFSLKEIFKFVCSVLDITLDKILTKIETATGKKGLKAKVLKIIAIGSKALGWLADLFKDGPAGIWDNLAKQVGNLWDMILDGVAGWIEKTLVGQMIKWVAEKLDPTGIMPVITSIIDFFNVVAGIANQARQILEIVDHTIDGIGDIIKGIIDKAAAFIEIVLADAIPVFMTILGYLFGMPDIADEVKDVVTSLRKKVDEGIDWLIKQGMELFNSLFGAADDDDKKGNIDAALAEIDKEGNDKVDDGEVTHDEADQIADDVKRDFPDVIETITVMDGGATWDFDYVQRTKGKEKIPKVKRPINTLKSADPVYTAEGGPVVKPLTTKVVAGNEDTIDIDGWDHAQKLNMAKSPDKQGRGGDWVRGHKISHRFGGDGKNKDNLFIIDRSANGNMKTGEALAETDLHTLAALSDKKKEDYNKVMFYRVTFTTHGGSLPFSAFADSIKISWGTANADADGTGEIVKMTKSVTSQKPPADAGDVKYKVNFTGWETFYKLTAGRGIKASFAQNLMRIREEKGKYSSKTDIDNKLHKYHNSDISDDTVDQQMDILNDIIDANLDLIDT